VPTVRTSHQRKGATVAGSQISPRTLIRAPSFSLLKMRSGRKWDNNYSFITATRRGVILCSSLSQIGRRLHTLLPNLVRPLFHILFYGYASQSMLYNKPTELHFALFFIILKKELASDESISDYYRPFWKSVLRVWSWQKLRTFKRQEVGWMWAIKRIE